MTGATIQGLSEAQRAQFHRDGYLVLRGLFAPKEVAELREAFMAQNADGPVPGLSEINPNYGPEDPLSFYPRMMHPHRHPEFPVGPLAMRTMLDSRVEAVLRDLFGEEPIAAQSMFYFKPPGARGQDLHQDNFYLRVTPGTCIAAWTAVDDADEENGTLVVVPGSNHREIYCPQSADSSRFFTTHHVPIPPGMEEVSLRLSAGDVLFFNGSLIHGSYPNTSANRFRRAFICHYVPRGSEEVSRWYRPLLTFDGQEVAIHDATGGGPCGTVQEAASPH
jgi:ectoine hydroxylase-related dioxygenase (phytanoyl-CoA dioxygenase family)